MKLFGGSGSQKHVSAEPAQKTPPPNTSETGERVPFYEAWFHSPVWKKLRTPLIVVGCVVLFMLVVLLVYSIWEKPPETESGGPNALHPQGTVQEPVENDPEKPKYTAPIPEETAEPEPSPDPTEEPLSNGRKEDCYTFALLAYDQYRSNTDTILVGRLDTAEGTLDFVSIPGDTLVNVSWGVKKLSTVLQFERNDPERFLSHLGDLIGFTPDSYAVMDIHAAEKLVDCIGGVYYNVPRDMDYDDPTQDLHIHIPAGYQLLNGENAVKVLRYRMGNDGSGYQNGDLGRIETQQDFLAAAAAQFLKLGNIPNLTQATELFQSSVETDLTANNLAFYVREFLMLEQENVRFHTLPGRGVSVRGGSYYEVGIDEWVGIVNDYLNPFEQVITADNLNILQCSADGGAVSTTGETVPQTSFYDYSQYTE